jgi:hypothetical protein
MGDFGLPHLPSPYAKEKNRKNQFSRKAPLTCVSLPAYVIRTGKGRTGAPHHGPSFESLASSTFSARGHNGEYDTRGVDEYMTAMDSSRSEPQFGEEGPIYRSPSAPALEKEANCYHVHRPNKKDPPFQPRRKKQRENNLEVGGTLRKLTVANATTVFVVPDNTDFLFEDASQQSPCTSLDMAGWRVSVASLEVASICFITFNVIP